MDAEIIKYFLGQGPFAVLFIWLLYSYKRESNERESKLYEMLDKFSEKYDIIVEKLDKLEDHWK